MKKTLLLILALLPGTYLFAQAIDAEPALENGTWTGFMMSPAKQLMDITLDVRHEGRAIDMNWAIGTFTWHRIRRYEDGLSFSWEAEPGFVMNCILKTQPRGTYLGACKDHRGRLGPMLIAPPGLDVHPRELDPDVGKAIWGRVENDEAEKVEVITLEGRPVDVGGFSLYATETGNGPATVVLESGLGDDHQLWIPVQQALSEFATVVSYDRAGLGKSDPSPNLRTPAHMAEELDRLLHAMKAAPPFVLVAHQMGGWVARTYAAKYPERVAALVLVDAVHEDYGVRLASQDPDAWHAYIDQQTTFYRITPAPVQAEFTAYKHILETAYLPDAETLPPVPIFVLSPTRIPEAPRWIGETEKGVHIKTTLQKTWTQPDRHRTTHTGSYIQSEAPEVLVATIRKAIEASGAGL